MHIRTLCRAKVAQQSPFAHCQHLVCSPIVHFDSEGALRPVLLSPAKFGRCLRSFSTESFDGDGNDAAALRRVVARLQRDPELLHTDKMGFLKEWVLSARWSNLLGKRHEYVAPPQHEPLQPRPVRTRTATVVPSSDVTRTEPQAQEPASTVSIEYPLSARGLGQQSLPDGLKVFIATPAYGGNVTVDYMTSIMQLVASSREVAWNLHLVAGESIITVGRNNCVMEFLASDCTHLLFLDADVSFTPDTIRGLLALDRDVALAPYPAKNLNEEKIQRAAAESRQPPRLQDGLHYVLHTHPDALKAALTAGSRFVEVEAGPTGCMLIRRNVFDRLREAYPELHCRINGSSAGRPYYHEVWWLFFDTMVDESGEFLGEDIAFCRRWRGAGGTIWADLGAHMGHVGRHSFAGSMLRSYSKK